MRKDQYTLAGYANGVNEKGHVINAVLLSVGLGVLLEPTASIQMVQTVLTVGVPVTIGALFPDIDTTFGTHRKTFHNGIVLAVFAVFPHFFDNLAYVWLGILTHYVLDLLGNVRGIALFYPYPELYDIPVGVPVGSRVADLVTLTVTVIELVGAWLVMRLGHEILLQGPGAAMPGIGISVGFGFGI